MQANRAHVYGRVDQVDEAHDYDATEDAHDAHDEVLKRSVQAWHEDCEEY
jgi:hypothetical protein